jgi:hypothetical protein
MMVSIYCASWHGLHLCEVSDFRTLKMQSKQRGHIEIQQYGRGKMSTIHQLTHRTAPHPLITDDGGNDDQRVIHRTANTESRTKSARFDT